MHFTSRGKVHQLNEEGSQKTAPSIGQSEEVQGDPSDVAWGQLEGYEGTCQRGSDSRTLIMRICDTQGCISTTALETCIK